MSDDPDDLTDRLLEIEESAYDSIELDQRREQLRMIGEFAGEFEDFNVDDIREMISGMDANDERAGRPNEYWVAAVCDLAAKVEEALARRPDA